MSDIGRVGPPPSARGGVGPRVESIDPPFSSADLRSSSSSSVVERQIVPSFHRDGVRREFSNSVSSPILQRLRQNKYLKRLAILSARIAGALAHVFSRI